MKDNLERQILAQKRETWVVFTDGKDTRAFAWLEKRLQFLRNIFPPSLIEEEISQLGVGRIYTDANGRRCQVTASPRALIRREEKMIKGTCDWLNTESEKEESFSGLILVAPSPMLDQLRFNLSPPVRTRIIAEIDKNAKPYNHALLEQDIAQILAAQPA